MNNKEITAIIYNILEIYNPEVDDIFEPRYVTILWYLYGAMEMVNDSTESPVLNLKDFKKLAITDRNSTVYTTVADLIKKGIDLQGGAVKTEDLWNFAMMKNKK